MIRFGVLLLSCLITCQALAIDSSVAFDDPDLQARYERIISEVRCLKCQNNSIRDSNVFLAADLRREIRRLISEGKSDKDIEEFLVTRYGEFALYRPRAQGKMLILWIAPFAILLLGGGILFSIIRKRSLLADATENSHVDCP